MVPEATAELGVLREFLSTFWRVMSLGPLTPSFARPLCQVAFILTWSLNEWVRTTPSGDEDDVQPTQSNPVVVESIKLALSAAYYLWQRKFSHLSFGARRVPNGHGTGEEALPLNGLDEDGVERVAVHADVSQWQRSEKRGDARLPPTIVVALTLLASVLFTYYRHMVRLSL